MRRKSIYESVGSSYSDNWMEQERRYEAKHSPWELDDNAAYLDEEHRRHCEAREARRAHERECEVRRPDYEQLNAPQQKRPAGMPRQPNAKLSGQQAKVDEEAVAKLILIILAIIAFIAQLYM